jgi:hypothetical protein
MSPGIQVGDLIWEWPPRCPDGRLLLQIDQDLDKPDKPMP